MSKAFRGIVVICLISLMVPYCHGVLDPKLQGRTIVQAFTPFYGNGCLNLEVVPQLAEFFAKNNIKNIQIMGFGGEGPILPLSERKILTSAWVKETDRLGLNLIVEVGIMPFPDQLELAKYCSQINVSAITAFPLLVYEAETIEDIIEDYQLLSDAAPNVALLYDSYTETGPRISPAAAVLALMGKVKTFAGAILSIESALNVKASVPSVDGYQLWIYGEESIVPTFAINMNGTIVRSPNLCPKLVLAMEAAVDAGNIDQALDIQQQLNRLIQAIDSNNGTVIDDRSRSYFQKLGAAYLIIRGLDLGTRLPFEEASSSVLATVRSNLREFEDLINCYCK